MAVSAVVRDQVLSVYRADPSRRFTTAKYAEQVADTSAVILDSLRDRRIPLVRILASTEVDNAVELACLAHGAVSVPGRRDNKVRSAHLCRSFATGHTAEIAYGLVVDMAHPEADYASMSMSGVVADSMLSVWATDRDTYLENVVHLRDEWALGGSPLSDEQWGDRRRVELERYMKTSHLFSTGYGRDHFEDAVRSNMLYELSSVYADRK